MPQSCGPLPWPLAPGPWPRASAAVGWITASFPDWAEQGLLTACHIPVSRRLRLQALVYDILPSTTVVFSYAIGSRKLSANEQFFVSAQTLVSLLQTTQIISDVCFITDHVAYAMPAQIKRKSFESRRNSFFFYPGWMRLMFTCVFGRWVASTVLSVPEPFGGRWPRRWTAARRLRLPLQWRN